MDLQSQNRHLLEERDFVLYLDESGSPKPDPNDTAPFFAIGGVLLERKHEAQIQSLLARFKERWGIDPTIPLHGNEIRSRKKGFAWLGKIDEQKFNLFMEELTDTIIQCPITVHACVVSRQGYLNRYLNLYGKNTWEMMRSAFSIVVERAAKYAANNNGRLQVYFERAGKTEDQRLIRYFNEMRSQGAPFNPNKSSQYLPLSPTELSHVLRGVDSRPKSDLLVQLADLCVYPVARGKNDKDYRAYNALLNAGKIIDCCIAAEEIKTLGVKYYCFDHI